MPRRSGMDAVLRLQRDGAYQLYLWRNFNMRRHTLNNAAVMIGIYLLVTLVFPLPLLWLAPLVYIALWLCLIRGWRVDTGRRIAFWRPRLIEHFSANLLERGLLLALLEAQPGTPLFTALGLDGRLNWLPKTLRLPTPVQQSFATRLQLLISRYVRCCYALSLEPFPPGFDGNYTDLKRNASSLWESLLKLTLAEILGCETPTMPREQC